MQNLIKGTKSNNQNHFKQNIPELTKSKCLMPLSAISWRPVLVVEASNW
jgi:hypothetical protein